MPMTFSIVGLIWKYYESFRLKLDINKDEQEVDCCFGWRRKTHFCSWPHPFKVKKISSSEKTESRWSRFQSKTFNCEKKVFFRVSHFLLSFDGKIGWNENRCRSSSPGKETPVWFSSVCLREVIRHSNKYSPPPQVHERLWTRTKNVLCTRHR